MLAHNQVQNALLRLIISLLKITSFVPLNHNSPEHRITGTHQNKTLEDQIREANVIDRRVTTKDDGNAMDGFIQRYHRDPKID